MSTLAVETERLAGRRRLPEAGQLWWKGQLARRWEAEARAVAPLDRMQRFEIGAGLVAALVLLGASGALVTPSRRTRPATSSDLDDAATGGSMALLATVAVTVVAASVFVLRRVRGRLV